MRGFQCDLRGDLEANGVVWGVSSMPLLHTAMVWGRWEGSQTGIWGVFDSMVRGSSVHVNDIRI